MEEIKAWLSHYPQEGEALPKGDISPPQLPKNSADNITKKEGLQSPRPHLQAPQASLPSSCLITTAMGCQVVAEQASPQSF